jgi:type II secretory pathway component PulF
MPWFEYEGHTYGGSLVTGRMEAQHADAARLELARMNLEVRELHPAEQPKPPPSTINAEELTFFNQQLAGLARAGLALDEGLAQLARDVQSHRLRHWIEDLVMDLRRGVPIDQALAARDSGLPVLYSEVVRAGIETGKLPAVLLNLNQHLQAANTTRRVIWEAISYPLVVGVLGLALVTFFFMVVVPPFRSIFGDFQTNLPAMTILALKTSEHFVVVLIVLGALFGSLVLLWLMLRCTPSGRRLWESLVMLVPVLGGVHRASLIARFLRAVSVSVDTGIPLPRAIRISSEATGSTLLRHDAQHMAEGVEQGKPILEANRGTRIIPPLFGYCVQAAASRENLPAALAELARAYEDRVTHGQGLLRLLLLPFFILVIGGIMFFAILAMFLPLVTLINCVSGGV